MSLEKSSLNIERDHYNLFNVMKKIREVDPRINKLSSGIYETAKRIEAEMGLQKYYYYNKVWNEVEKKTPAIIHEVTEKINRLYESNNFSEMHTIIDDTIELLGNKVKENRDIKLVFKDNWETLDEAINFLKHASYELIMIRKNQV